jgi:hypothetical protein
MLRLIARLVAELIAHIEKLAADAFANAHASNSILVCRSSVFKVRYFSAASACFCKWLNWRVNSSRISYKRAKLSRVLLKRVSVSLRRSL